MRSGILKVYFLVKNRLRVTRSGGACPHHQQNCRDDRCFGPDKESLHQFQKKAGPDTGHFHPVYTVSADTTAICQPVREEVLNTPCQCLPPES